MLLRNREALLRTRSLDRSCKLEAKHALRPAAPAYLRRYVKGVESFFLWQNIGAGLMTVTPAVT